MTGFRPDTKSVFTGLKNMMLIQIIKNKLRVWGLIILSGVCVWGMLGTPLQAEKDSYPKLAAFHLWGTRIPDERVEELAKWDVVILDMQNQVSSPEVFPKIRRLNPDIILLAYTTAIEYPKYRLTEIEPNHDGLWTELGKGLKPEWYLLNSRGDYVTYWPGNVMLYLGAKDNQGETYSDYLVRFLKTKVKDSGLWDGLIFDTVWNNVDWVEPDIDINRDGVPDSKASLNRNWFNAHNRFYKDLRKAVGSDFYIVINGVGDYHNSVNGRMFEGFPEYWEGGWQGSMEDYQQVERSGYQPRLNIINTDTENSGNRNDYRMMRFGLASALMGKGYYSFDYGTEDRSYLWWYDEYDYHLGRALTEPYNLASDIYRMAEAGPGYFAKGIWRRDFENGIALVNSTDQKQSVDLKGEFEHLRGIQDPVVNNGRVVSKVDLEAEDGVMMLRPLSEISGEVFPNGGFAKVFNSRGESKRNGFFVFENRIAGGDLVLSRDLFGDSGKEKVAAGQNKITIYDSRGGAHCSFYPFTENYRGKVSFDVGDLEGDGSEEIVVGVGAGGGPYIRIFNQDCRLLTPGFFAYARDFRGGIDVALGNLDGRRGEEIVVGAGVGGQSRIRVFDKNGKMIHTGFFARNGFYSGEVKVGVGDVNGNGKNEIVALLPQAFFAIRIFNSGGIPMGSEFYPGDLSGHADHFSDLVVADLDGDREYEILFMTLDVFGLNL